MGLMLKIADNTNAESLAARMRRRRLAFFASLLTRIEGPLRILDVGGTEAFWETLGFAEWKNTEIVLLNLENTIAHLPGFTSLQGDARAMTELEDDTFDVVFSNSVIEHVGALADQRSAAREMRRVGRRFFVQTPNRYFPIEPHFLVPFFQFLPVSLRARLLTRFNLGWEKQIPDYNRAREHVTQIRLLNARELEALFPGTALYRERFLGLTKSLVAYGGW